VLKEQTKVKQLVLAISTALANSFADRVLALVEHNRVRFGTLKVVVDKYLDKCGRQWVAMDSLFGKLGFTA
jgi:DNA polymerase alpha subunit A